MHAVADPRRLVNDGLVGGVRTNVTSDGLCLDRGFHVLITARPALRRAADLRGLDLRPFDNGAAVATDCGSLFLRDPLRQPSHALEVVASPLLTWGDRLRPTALALWAWSRAPDVWLPPARRQPGAVSPCGADRGCRGSSRRGG